MANPPYNALMGRPGTGGELPHDMAAEVMGDVKTSSTVLDLARVITTDTRDTRIPVLSTDVDAYFVAGDSGLKGTSAPQWASTAVVAEELAVLVPVPDSVLSDSSFDVWSEVRPLVARAFARKIDMAVLFGVDRPSTWATSLVDMATAGSATVTAGTDPVADVLTAAEIVSSQQLSPSAVAVRPGWEWSAAASRSTSFTASPVGRDAGRPFPVNVAGLGVYTAPVAWDRTKAEALVADWSQVIVGMRTDLRFEVHNSGVITDGNNIITNLLQQDSSALRCTMRLGVTVRRPVIGTNAPALPVALVQPVVEPAA